MAHLTKTFLLRILLLIIAQIRTMSLILGLCGITLGLGFLVGDTGNPNYHSIKEFAPISFWAFGFFTYGVIKLLHSVFRVHHSVKLLNALQGIWVWTFLFLSFSIFDSTPLAPTELLLIIPIICELWEIVIAIFNFSTYPYRRKEDTR